LIAKGIFMLSLSDMGVQKAPWSVSFFGPQVSQAICAVSFHKKG
jgi:hypothetical protein